MPEDRSALERRVAVFLDTNHVLSLATSGADGPHAANLFYARDGHHLMWVSDPGVRHSRELEADARVSATIAPDTSDHALIRGAQVHGAAHRVTDAAERSRLLSQLVARYAFLAKPRDAPPKMAAAFDAAGVYRLKPRRIVLIDNSLGFGHKDILDFPD